jgi:hypothetical protein
VLGFTAKGPYRVADPSPERYGPLVAQYGRSRLAVARSLGLAALMTLLGLGSFISVAGPLEDGAPQDRVAALMAGCIAWTVAAALTVHFVRSRGLHLELRKHGVIYRTNRRVVAMLWDDVVELRVSRRNLQRWSGDSCTLVSREGQRLELTDQLSGVDELSARLEQDHVLRLLPDCLSAVQEGRPAAFGPFTVSAEGLAHRDRRLLWKDVAGGGLAGHLLVIADAKNGIRVLPKYEGIVAWAREPYDAIPNAALLLALVKMLRPQE